MNGYKVMIVEDDMITARDIAQQLEAEGCEIVIMANDAHQALDLLTKTQPDLALLDIGLGKGKMDGVELACNIRKTNEMPIIFLTAYADQPTVDRAMHTMPASYLLKPVNSRQLIVSINLAMSRFSLTKSIQPDYSTNDQKTIENDHFIFNNSIFVKKKERFVKNQLAEILWIEADGNYSTIITNQNKFTIIITLSAFLKHLSNAAPYIVRVHRSYAINLNQIESFDNMYVILNGREIPLGKCYRRGFFKLIGYK